MPRWNLLSQKDVTSIEDIGQVILNNRQIVSDLQSFFETTINFEKYQAFLGKDFFVEVEKANNFINKHIKEEKNIIIFGDYDADGITATTLLWEALYKEKEYKKVYPFIPNRFSEGYGLSIAAIDNLILKYKIDPKDTLLITVDCGITAVEQVEYAKDLGFAVIITDHHQKPDVLPKSDLLVWSDKICGVGISYFVVSNILETSDFGLDLVAVGTVADLQELTHVNRDLVSAGIKELNQTTRLGFKALFEIAKIGESVINSFDIGYKIAPRINAAGRLDDAYLALKLLCTENKNKAREYAIKLNTLNIDRQNKTFEMLEKANTMYKEDEGIVIVSSSEFHEGVIGLIASHLTKSTYKPALVIKEEGEMSKGSARSIPEVDIIKTLREFDNLFDNLGGHSGAAGFSVKTENLQELKTSLYKYFKDNFKDLPTEPILEIDTKIDINIVNANLYKFILQFEPFGIGNFKPLFLGKDLRVADFRVIGKNNDHLSLSLENEGKFIRGVAFGFGAFSNSINFDDLVDVVFEISENNWNGNTSYEMLVKDIKKS